MAVTRIKNNQITDSTINAAAKLQDYSITSTKIANSLTYGSDLTVSGNLTVNGTTTTIDTVNFVVEDPLIVLAKDQTGAPSLDIGFIGRRGTENNIAFVWDESQDEFVTAFTTDLITNTTITINSYASFRTLDATVGGNLSVTGTSLLTGNITVGNIFVNGQKNIDVGNSIIANVQEPVANSDAATKGYVDTIASSGFTIEDDTANTTTVSGGDTLELFGTANEVTVAITGVDQVTFGLPNDVTISNSLIVTNTVSSNIGAFTGNVSAANIAATSGITAGTTIVATGNITGGNLLTGGLVSATGNIVSSANVAGGNVIASANLVSVGAVVSGNITGGNVITAGLVSAGTLSTAGNAIIGGNLVVQGNITYINIDDLRVEDPIIILGTGPNGAPLTVNDGKDRGVFMEYYTTGLGNAFMGFDNSTGNMIIANNVSFSGNDVVQVNAYGTLEAGNAYLQSATTTGNVTAAGLSVTGNISGGNILTGGVVTATGNVTGGNLTTSGLASVTGNITGGNLITAGLVSATGNVSAGNITTGGNVVATANVSGNNATFTHNVNANNFIATGTVETPNVMGTTSLTLTTNSNGNITLNPDGTGVIILTDETANRMLFTGANKEINTDANATFDGANLVITGSLQVDNVTVNGADITSNTSELTINNAGADINFRVAGDTQANLLLVDAGTDTVLVNTGTTTTGATFKIGGTSSLMVPVGTTGERPLGVTGMVRFNTSLNNLEFYDADSWETAGSQFTVISANTQTGDGSTVAFTLPVTGTTAGTIVSINGVVQIPTTAYSVSGNVCTFTEAPESTDVIDFRQLATTTEVTGISAFAGAGLFEGSPTAATFTSTGNIVPTANITYDLGSSALRWKDLYLSGSSLTLGNVVMKNLAGGNVVAFYGPDGTTPATIASTSVDTTQIASGTSNMAVIATNGNIRANVAGTTVAVISSTGVEITGNLSVTGNATLSGNILGDRVQNGTTSFDIQTQNGNANISVGGVSNVAVFTTAGANVTGTLGVTGNITGSYIFGNGSQLTGIDATSIQNGTANVRTFLNGNVALSAAGVANVGLVTSTGVVITGTLSTGTGNITGGNLSVSTGTITVGNIVNANANGVGNIGSATTYFNTVFAKATSAQYADLAEMYEADADIAPGTVVSFGGDKEVTACDHAEDTRVAGVVSTNPSYLMNSAQGGTHVVAVALTGRVPCRVVGTVRKGDLMVAAGNGAARAKNDARIGTVIGKALQDFDGAAGVIEVVVGRL